MIFFGEAKTPKEKDAIFGLRYRVYCLEKQWLNPDDYPDGKESDEYDKYSVHFFAADTNHPGKVLGAFRLILPSSLGFPAEKHFDLFFHTPNRVTTVEMSRLVIDREARSSQHRILLGLTKEVYLYNRTHGITHCYAVVDRPLFQMLQRLGLPFVKAGKPAQYMGDTFPTILIMEEIETLLPQNNVWYYAYLQEPKEPIEAREEREE